MGPEPTAGSWVGLGPLLGLAGWPVLAHGTTTDSWWFLALVLGAGLAWVAALAIGRVRPASVGILVAAGVGVAFAAGLPESLGGEALAPPLGYGNANGALLVAGVAGLVGSWPALRRAGRVGALVAGLAFTVAAVLTASVTATVSCVLLLAIAPATGRGSVRLWQLVSGCALAAGVVATAVIGATYDSEAPPSLVTAALSEARPALWRDALDLAATHPWTGVGLGRFADLSPTAADPDLAWAHSAPLQLLAETGLVGLALLLGLVGWLVWRLGRGAAVLAVLALQPMVDYVLHFPAVLLVYAMVLGGLAATGGAQGGRQRDLAGDGSFSPVPVRTRPGRSGARDADDRLPGKGGSTNSS